MSRDIERQRAEVDKALDVDYTEVRREVRRLREIEEWALGTLPFAEGDAVVLAEPVNANGGWMAYREVLVPGRTGTAHGFWLHSVAHEWHCYFTPDDCWSVSNYPHEGTRRRKDPPGCFMIAVRKLRRRTEADDPLPVPTDLIEARR